MVPAVIPTSRSLIQIFGPKPLAADSRYWPEEEVDDMRSWYRRRPLCGFTLYHEEGFTSDLSSGSVVLLTYVFLSHFTLTEYYLSR